MLHKRHYLGETGMLKNPFIAIPTETFDNMRRLKLKGTTGAFRQSGRFQCQIAL